MRELDFDGLSPDGTRLILAGKDGQKWSVVIDERIEAAVRRDRARIAQVEIEQSGDLRPREIQARIRSGATAADVAAASGLPIEHIRRFEGPVLTERAWVAQQAQATEVRRPGGDIALGEQVAARLLEQGVEPDDIAWDAWRRDDGLWVVIATFPIGSDTLVATWRYDSGSRTMTVADDNARALSSVTPGASLALAPTRPNLASVAPLSDSEASGGIAEAEDLAPLPSFLDSTRIAYPHDVAPLPRFLDSEETADGQVDDAIAAVDDDPDLPTDPEASPDVAQAEDAPDAEPPGSGPTLDAEDVPLFDAPPAPNAAPTGRPPVPSFDDILFGPGPRP